MRKLIALGFILFLFLFQRNGFSQQDLKNENFRAVKIDSLVDTYSIEEIIRYRNYYQKQIEGLEEEKVKLRQKGISDAESFLQNNPNSKVLDKVIMRLAELYYEDANDIFIRDMQKYDEALEKSKDVQSDSLDIQEPKKDYSKTLELYQRIIDEYQHSELLDDALYNKGFILEEIGKIREALDIYNYIIKEFPESRYVPESLMRIAEYHFNPPKNEIDTAIGYYKQILEYRDSPKYDEALYRLGWSYYRKNEYSQAVSYFTLLVDDVDRATKIDPSQKYSNTALRDESVEYIGISFLDYGGTSKAVEYINNIGKPDYGAEILKKIGDVYMNEKEMYDKAIEAYQILLDMYPDNEDAPVIQEKIVLCYRHTKDDMMAYLSRDKLFNEYKPGSPWWQKHKLENVRDKIYHITERSLRDNINLLFQRAEESGDRDLYLPAVNDGRKYLKTFPADTNAPLIHWNMALTMDTKLKLTEEAFEEYMKICDLYWDSKYQKFAAENAIALAKDAVEMDTVKKNITTTKSVQELQQDGASVLSAIEYPRIELTENEKKLVRAYNNYIKIFPHEKQTATILANAGALYYNNNQFPEALRYLNTIVKHFPNIPDIDYVKYTIMESYFGKHDFKSSEIVARRLKNKQDLAPELAAKTKKRLAESIFLAAEVFADSADHLQAGNEYLRVVMEVPNAEFADLSLFNAALEYDKAKEFSRAIETYNYLIETRSNSKYLLDAMNNLAIDYGELKEYKNAAITYEKLALATKDSLQQHDALYNSSLFFVKGEEWEDAIRINSNFVQKFPDSEDADDLFFDIATYYLKLDKLDKANEIYGEYTQKFPDSPRVVETYFHRGEYYRDKDEINKAKAEYQRAVSKNEEFKINNLQVNNYFAAEAQFQLTQLRFDEYRRISFELPKERMEQNKNRKRELLIEVVNGFTKVASYGTLRLYEATYNIGTAYEEFAISWVNQEIPFMEETKKIVTQKEINETTAELYLKAEDSYKQSTKILTRLADDYEKSLLQPDSTITVDLDLNRIVNEDSTLRVARKWIERCKEKISEMIYDIAELNFSTVNAFLEAPIPEGLNHVAEMEYRRQVLGKAITPLIQDIVDAHVRNLEEAWELGLENQWVKLSRRKVVTSNNLLASEYNKLAHKSLELYKSGIANYNKIVEKGGVSPEGFDTITLSDQMANLIDFNRAFASVTVDIYRKTLERADKENINDPSVSETKEKMLKDLYYNALACDSLTRITKMYRKKYEALFKETDKIEYEDALFTFEDNSFSLKESQKELLELGYQISQDLQIKNQWAPKITLALVQVSPDEYSSLLALNIETEKITSDESWKANASYCENWIKKDFPDDDWNNVVYVENSKLTPSQNLTPVWFSVIDTIGFYNDTTFINEAANLVGHASPDSLGHDSTRVDSTRRNQGRNFTITRKPKLAPVPAEHVYLRKKFKIQGLPVSCELKLKIDDSYNLFLNGEYVANFNSENGDGEEEHTHQLGELLVEGINTLAIEGIDKNATAHGAIATLVIKSIPEWNDKKQQIQIETSDENIRKNLVMDKYIIMY